jgi:hypothetical protein
MSGEFAREEYVFITYNEAQRAKEFLKNYAKTSSDKEIKSAAIRLVSDLEAVRSDVDYSPFKGYQLIINSKDREFLENVLDATSRQS